MKKPAIEEFVLEEFGTNEQVDFAIQLQPETESKPKQPQPNTDEIYQKAFSEGYEKGKSESLANSEQQLLSLKNEYEAKLENLNMQFQQSIHSIDSKIGGLKDKINSIENDIVNVALEIAQKIIEKEIQDKDTMINLIKKSLSFAKSDKVKLKVNAKLAKNIENEFKNIEIIGDPNLDMGAIVIEEDSNIIDASINTKLEELKRNLINES